MLKEIRQDYALALKKTIFDYVLQSPRERLRLGMYALYIYIYTCIHVIQMS